MGHVRRSTRRVVQDIYRYAPPSSLNRENFFRHLRNYLDAQLTTNVDDEVAEDLFNIVSEGLRDDTLKRKLRTPRASQDLKATERLVKTLSSRINDCLRVLSTYERRKLLLTTALAKKLEHQFRTLQRTLGQTELQCRVHSKMTRMLKETPYPGEISLAIDDYLRTSVGGIESQKERDHVIAGCLTGAWYSKTRGTKDLLSAIAMQRSRGREDYVAGQRILWTCPHCSTMYVADSLERVEPNTVRCKNCEQASPLPLP